MAENTGIAWTHHTWSPWWGCWEVSPACAHCYARELDARYGGPEKHWGPSAPRRFFGDAHWKLPLRWNRSANAAHEHRRVFPSMCDPFEARHDLDAPRQRLFRLIEDTPWLTWLLLTKRPENAAAFAPPSWGQRWPGNVWFGFTAENQDWFNRRIDHALSVPANVRFCSYEPALGPINFGAPLGVQLHQVIVGGESGSGHRPMEPAWLSWAARQCDASGAALFVKQDSGHRPGRQGRIPDGLWARKEFPA